MVTTSNSNPQLVDKFAALSTDQQLTLLWYIYTEVGKTITPAAPGASTASPGIAAGIFQQVRDLSYAEQLQVQRDLVERKNTPICQEYGSLSATTKLLFWYLLAQGMEQGDIVPMPDGYQLEPGVAQCLTDLQALDYSAQITILREYVAPMGSEATDL